MEQDDLKLTEAGSRITALNEVNQDVPKMLAAAGKAIKLLTSSPLPDSVKDRKDGFLDETRQYFTLLKSINDRLQTEFGALEDSGLVANEDKKKVDKINAVSNGGLGNFDVAWLNARSRDVGAQKEAELMKQARIILEDMVGEKEDVHMNDA